MIQINTFEFNVVFCSELLITCWDTHWLLKKPLRLQLCLFFESEPSAFYLSSQILTKWNKTFKLTHWWILFLLVLNLSFHSILFCFFLVFFYRTSLWLGENRGPSVWDILCWVSLLPQWIVSPMFFFHYTALGNAEYSSLCLCNPAFKFFHEGKEKLGAWEFTSWLQASWTLPLK